jgi:hypothetical protein
MKTFGKGKIYLKTKPCEGNDLIMLETQIVEVKHGFEGFVSRVKQAISKLLGRPHISTSNSSKSGMSK